MKTSNIAGITNNAPDSTLGHVKDPEEDRWVVAILECVSSDNISSSA